MSRSHAAVAIVVLSLGAGFGLIASNDVHLEASPRGQDVASAHAVADQEILVLDLAPGPGRPPIQEFQAITLAESLLPTLAESTSIQSRYVSLTLRDSDGGVAWGLQSRPAWLVTFKGVRYAPFGRAASACACSAIYERPNTMAALDARTGALISYFGIDN
jgi:hypothetical protein